MTSRFAGKRMRHVYNLQWKLEKYQKELEEARGIYFCIFKIVKPQIESLDFCSFMLMHFYLFTF